MTDNDLPRFAKALDNVETCDDQTFVADCPICRQLLLVLAIDGWWELQCDGGCTHDELVNWLKIDDLRANHKDGARVWVALMLATTPDVWAALLNGEPVNDEALDQEWLTRFRKAGVL